MNSKTKEKILLVKKLSTSFKQKSNALYKIAVSIEEINLREAVERLALVYKYSLSSGYWVAERIPEDIRTIIPLHAGQTAQKIKSAWESVEAFMTVTPLDNAPEINTAIKLLKANGYKIEKINQE